MIYCLEPVTLLVEPLDCEVPAIGCSGFVMVIVVLNHPCSEVVPTAAENLDALWGLVGSQGKSIK